MLFILRNSIVKTWIRSFVKISASAGLLVYLRGGIVTFRMNVSRPASRSTGTTFVEKQIEAYFESNNGEAGFCENHV